MKSKFINVVKTLLLSLLLVFHIPTTISASGAPLKTGYVQVNGMKTYYEIHGTGTTESMPIIVLHGAYMNIQNMGDIIPKLAKTHKVYALEMQDLAIRSPAQCH